MTDVPNPADEHEVIGLVFPFVVVQSKGGPLDDAAFVAGYECGRLDVRLGEAPDTAGTVLTTVHAVTVPQLDLIAMHHGWTLTVEPTAVDEWVHVEFTRTPA